MLKFQCALRTMDKTMWGLFYSAIMSSTASCNHDIPLKVEKLANALLPSALPNHNMTVFNYVIGIKVKQIPQYVHWVIQLGALSPQCAHIIITVALPIEKYPTVDTL